MSKMPSRIYNEFLSRTFRGTKIFLISAVVLMASCKKESDIGSGIQPSGDVIDLQSQDSLTLKTYTVKEDSLRSDEPAIVQIGNINDPIFGETRASLFTQFVIPNDLQGLAFPGTLDSCALCLAYDYDYYGDTTSPQEFRVYQMTEDIYHDSLYYSNKVSQCYPTFASRIYVGDTTVTPHPRKKITLGSNTYQPQLRIPIQYNFAQQIFSGSYSNTAAFLQFMKGLYVESVTTPTPGSGALLRFNLLDTTTKLIFYYHTSNGPTSFSFVVNSGAAYYSHFAHDYSTLPSSSSLVQQLASPGVNTSNEVYVSGCSGVKTKIEFPYLNNLRNLGYSIAINKAELIIKADPSTASADFPANKQLYVTSIDTSGKQLLLPDMFENSVYFGGSLITSTNEYHINIARYFQELMSGIVPNNGLYLKEIDPDSQGRRVVLGSSNFSSSSGTNNYRMYLHLVYTRIN